MTYEVRMMRKAEKALARIDGRDRRKVEQKIEALATDPRPSGCTKLTGVDGYRVRSGDYRIVYLVADSVRVVTITHVGHRRSIYQGR